MTDKVLAYALVKLQAELPVIPFDSTNPHFKSNFASLKAIREIVQPLLAKHGFAWVAKPSSDEHGNLVLDYALVHNSGGEIVGSMPLIAGTTPQSQGSALTYARRYALSAVLGIVADADDDANAASHEPSRGAVSTPSGAASGAAPSGKKAEVVGPCPVCAELGLRANGDKDPALFKDLKTGRVQCNGRRPDGGYANHAVEQTEPVGDVDPTEIPF